MVPINPSSSIISLGSLRERESQAKPHQVEGTSLDLKPNMGMVLDFAKLSLG